MEKPNPYGEFTTWAAYNEAQESKRFLLSHVEWHQEEAKCEEDRERGMWWDPVIQEIVMTEECGKVLVEELNEDYEIQLLLLSMGESWNEKVKSKDNMTGNVIEPAIASKVPSKGENTTKKTNTTRRRSREDLKRERRVCSSCDCDFIGDEEYGLHIRSCVSRKTGMLPYVVVKPSLNVANRLFCVSSRPVCKQYGSMVKRRKEPSGERTMFICPIKPKPKSGLMSSRSNGALEYRSSGYRSEMSGRPRRQSREITCRPLNDTF